MLISLLAAFIGAAIVAADIDSFANVTVYDASPSEPSYARTENLPNNTVLATWQDASVTNTLSIYRSIDSGFSWYTLGTVTSDTTGRTFTQPSLLYLNQTYGSYDAGAIVLAVNAQDAKSTNIEIYLSQDSGETWQYVSTPATGGPVTSTNEGAVLEPFLLYHDKKITVYYSDQRDASAGQKISHQTTSDDLDSWGSAINDEAERMYSDRPGKPSVAKLSNSQYVLAFEYGVPNASSVYHYPIYYKIASSPENFGTSAVQQINVNTGVRPRGAPFVTWSPLGGANGTIVVSDSQHNSVFINRALGQGNWTEVKTTAGRAYSREVRLPNNDSGKLRFAGGAEQGQDNENQVLVTVFDFNKTLSTLPAEVD